MLRANFHYSSFQARASFFEGGAEEIVSIVNGFQEIGATLSLVNIRNWKADEASGPVKLTSLDGNREKFSSCIEDLRIFCDLRGFMRGINQFTILDILKLHYLSASEKANWLIRMAMAATQGGSDSALRSIAGESKYPFAFCLVIYHSWETFQRTYET
jgi:hypothetical protein